MDSEIRKSNKIPGSCDTYTRPEEIGALAKYLKKVKDTLEESTSLIEDNLELTRKATLKDVNELPDGISVLSGTGNDVSRLVSEKEWINSGKDLDSLEKTKETIKDNTNIELANEKTRLSVGDKNNSLEKVKEKLFRSERVSASQMDLTAIDKVDNLDGETIKIKEKNIESLDNSKVKINDNTNVKLGDSLEKLNDIKENSLSSQVEKIKENNDLNRLGENLEKINVNDQNSLEYERIGIQVKDTTTLDKSLEKIEDTNKISLENTRENIKVDDINNLGTERLDLSRGNDVSLDDNLETLRYTDNTILENNLEKIKVEDQDKLSNTRENLNAEDNIGLSDFIDNVDTEDVNNLSTERLEINIKEDQSLSTSRENIEVENINNLSTTRLGINATDTSSLSSQLEKLMNTNEATELESSLEKLDGSDDIALSSIVSRILGTEDVDLSNNLETIEDDRSIVLSSIMEKLGEVDSEINLSNQVETINDNTDLELSNKVEVIENNEINDLDENLEIIKDNSTIDSLSTSRENISASEDQELSNIRENLDDVSDSELSDVKINIDNVEDQDLSTTRLDISDTSDNNLSTILETLEDTTENELSTTVENISVEDSSALSDIRENINANEDQELSEHIETINSETESDLSTTRLDISTSDDQELSDIRVNITDDTEQELSTIREDLNNTEDLELSNIREDINTNDELDLSDIRENLENIEDQELSTERLDIDKNEDQDLSDIRLNIDKPEDQELSNTRLDITDGQDINLSDTRLDIDKNEDLDLSNVRLNIDNIENKDLSDTRLDINKPDDIDLSTERLDIDKNEDQDLSDIRLNIDKPEDQELSNTRLDITDGQDINLSDTRLDIDKNEDLDLSNWLEEIDPIEDLELSDKVIEKPDDDTTKDNHAEWSEGDGLYNTVLGTPNVIEDNPGLSSIKINAPDDDINKVNFDKTNHEAWSENDGLYDSRDINKEIRTPGDDNDNNNWVEELDEKDPTALTRTTKQRAKDSGSYEGKPDDNEENDWLDDIIADEKKPHEFHDIIKKRLLESGNFYGPKNDSSKKQNANRDLDHTLSSKEAGGTDKGDPWTDSLVITDEDKKTLENAMKARINDQNLDQYYNYVLQFAGSDEHPVKNLSKGWAAKVQTLMSTYLSGNVDASQADEFMYKLNELYLNKVGLYRTPNSKLPLNPLSTAVANPTTYIRWVAEQTGNLITNDSWHEGKISGLRTGARALLIDATLWALISARRILEVSTKANRDRLPGSDTGLLQDIIAGSNSSLLSTAENLVVDTVLDSISGAKTIDTSSPMNRPNVTSGAGNLGTVASAVMGSTGEEQKTETSGWEKVSIRRSSSIFDPTNATSGDNPTGSSGKGLKGALKSLAKNAVKNILGTKADNSYYSFKDNYLQGLGIYTTLSELAEVVPANISTVEGLKRALQTSPLITMPGKFMTAGKGDYNTFSLDTNMYWEIILEPFTGIENGKISYLPSIQEINTINAIQHGVYTAYSRWIPFAGFELSKGRLNTKNLSLFDGEISYPISMEFTNELRLTIVDDQYKSWRTYFERCAEVSIYSSEQHKPSYYGFKEDDGITYTGYDVSKNENIEKDKNTSNLVSSSLYNDTTHIFNLNSITAIDKNYVLPALYKNITFRCQIYSMTPQYSTISKYDLLIVLKDFSEERSGDIDGGANDLSLTFSIVGENPSGKTSDDIKVGTMSGNNPSEAPYEGYAGEKPDKASAKNIAVVEY